MAQTRKKSAPQRPKADPRSSGPTPILEWMAAIVGLGLLLFTVTVVAVEAFQSNGAPPAVVVENLGVRQTDAGYLVMIRATNRGGSAAAQVMVEGSLVKAGAEPETAEASFDFIADHSSRDGGLFFGTDPRAGQLTLRAKGYVAP